MKNTDPTSTDDAWFAYDDTTGAECIWNTLYASRFDPKTRHVCFSSYSVLSIHFVGYVNSALVVLYHDALQGKAAKAT